MFKLFIFIFGLIVGSFLNCVVYRIEARDKGGITSFIKGRPQRKAFGFLRGKSFCPHCRKPLVWYDLFPIISFFILRGKCRNCQKSISWQYPIVELLTGLMFVSILSLQFSIFDIIFWWIISCLLITIFIYDLKHLIIPDRLVFSAIGLTLIYQIINLKSEIFDNLLAGLIVSSLFLFMVIISKGKWMGGGDVKLAFLIGLLLGFPDSIVALFFSFFLGAIIGVGLILIGKKGLKSEVAFGPFLVAGIFIALFWADKIIEYYFKFFIV